MSHIVIDIGNTRVKAALFVEGQLKESAFFQHEHQGLMQRWLASKGPSSIITSSTASESYEIEALKSYSSSIIKLESDTPLPVKNSYQSETLGRDRIANAVIGNELNPDASLVIDAGTCVTYDWTIKGEYLGGGVSPGVFMRLRAMHEFTGRLPLVEELEKQDLIGNSTKSSLLSGALNGLRLEIDGIISEFLARYPHGSAYLTGGDSMMLAEELENDIFADPLLTLRGLHVIQEYNIA